MNEMNSEEMRVGCFQVVLLLLLGVNYIIVAMSHALPLFHYYTPNFYCETDFQVKNKSYGCVDLKNILSNSQRNETSLTNAYSLPSCLQQYYFEMELGERSVVTEWTLICERKYLISLGTSVYFLGIILGAWISGILIDRMGRLPVLAICLYAQGTLAVALYVVQDYLVFLTLRGLQGIFVQGLQNSTFILIVELFPAVSRPFVSLIMQISWALGLTLLAVLSYVVPDWRILQLAISVPTAVTVLYIWMVPESPRWLLATGKSTEADMALERISKYNVCCTRQSKDIVACEEESEIINGKPTPVQAEQNSLEFTTTGLQEVVQNSGNPDESQTLLSVDEEKQPVDQTKCSPKDLRKVFDSEHSDTETIALRTEIQETTEIPSSSKRRKSRNKYISRLPDDETNLGVDDIIELRISDYKQDETKLSEESIKRISIEHEEIPTDKSMSLKEMLSHKYFIRYTAVMIYEWFAMALSHYLFTSLIPNLNATRHFTFAMGGLLEIIVNILTYFVISRYGRRIPLSIYQFLNGVVCVGVGLFALPIIRSYVVCFEIINTALILLGRIVTTGLCFTIQLYTTEIFPTILRGTCLGICTASAKIGSICAIYLLQLDTYSITPTPTFIIGSLSFVPIFLNFIMPESSNVILPDTLDQTEKMHKLKAEHAHGFDETGNSSMLNNTGINRQTLRKKLFSENWVDVGNGIIVNFSDKETE